MAGSDFQERASATAPDLPGLDARVLISEIRAAYVGPGMNLSPHKNAVATIAVALTDSFDVDLTGPHGCTLEDVRAALIPADTLHHLRSRGHMAFVYIDPLSDDVTPQLENRSAKEWARAGDHVVSVVHRMDPSTPAAAQIALLCGAIGLATRPRPDHRLEQAIRAIDRHPDRFESIEQASAVAGLSTSRFQHLFRDATGTSFRRYRLWKRMAAVGRSLKCGDTLTVAALDAGFSSSAHLSSTFRSMFGIKPSDLLARQVRFCVDAAETV